MTAASMASIAKGRGGRVQLGSVAVDQTQLPVVFLGEDAYWARVQGPKDSGR